MTTSSFLWYLATPYSKYPAGLEAAYQDACRVAALAAKAGLNVFSPIAHSHGLALHGDIDPVDHDIWMRIDEPFMAKCDGLIVVRMEGWEDSRGVTEEIKRFIAAGKPVLYCDPLVGMRGRC